MKELLYIEVPTPDTLAVRRWLQEDWQAPVGVAIATVDGVRLDFPSESRRDSLSPALSIFVWSLQRTTYLKVFRWNPTSLPQEAQILKQLESSLRAAFPPTHPELPPFDPSQETIFEALTPYYPKTVTYFQRMPNGEADLERAYWWEKRWRDGVRSPQDPKQVIFHSHGPETINSQDILQVDLVYVGGALGVIHAAVMANLGHKVLMIERLPFGRMNREWNISRQEFQSLIDLGLFTEDEFQSLIAREYEDGFNKFFDANNPSIAKAPVLHTPTVLNIALDSEALLKRCGEKLLAAGGLIWDGTEFEQAQISDDSVTVQARHRSTGEPRAVKARLLVDAMGTASPIAWQLNNGRAFDSVCPTAGACISSGFAPAVWDSTYGDVLFSHGDISRGRQLIWELFPAKEDELTIYLFHYHKVHPDNPGSLLTMYEDFFHILPEYRRCNLDKLTWRKPTFGYIPGYFSMGKDDRTIAFDRLITIGDAASLQSPLVFTGFGSLIRNLSRLTHLLEVALRHDLLKAKHLNQIRAFQSNIAITWLFSKGMMVPTGQAIPPARINSMLNTFFGILEAEDRDVADRFIKDRATWSEFNRMALTAASKNPALLLWIWQLAGVQDLLRWVGSYLNYTWQTFILWLFSWFPTWLDNNQKWVEKTSPPLFFWMLAQSYHLTYGMGTPRRTSAIRIQPAKSADNKSQQARVPSQNSAPPVSAANSPQPKGPSS
ncbi:MAG: NAD(P)/FAD-dependent oxidoreductase [Leptolyngbyaceae cyanobacterium]